MTLYLDSGAKLPLYRQLYDYLAGEILSGRLAAGERLPGKRRLAEDLRVSVNTVDTAYQMLSAEGYLQARPRSGFVVCRVERLASPARPEPAPAEEPRPEWRFDLGTSGVDAEMFPFKTWRRIQRDVLAGNPDLLNRGHPQGDRELREAVAAYLRDFRGADCSPERIVIGAGMEYLLSLLARMFPGEIFAVEDPGYPQTCRVLENNGASVVFLPVDGQGLSGRALAESGARLAYVTPSHQFPTGATMPAGRRSELLRWAAEKSGRCLIEDDYDSEFRFDGRPLPSLLGMDRAGAVVSIGTFSRSIAPAIRVAYMVLPPPLLERFRAEFGFYACTVSRIEQQTLCRFLAEGHYARHLARERNLYRRRRDRFSAALKAAFAGEKIRLLGTHTGLHLLLELPAGGPADAETLLADRARSRRIRLSGLSRYRHGGAAGERPALVLGYGRLKPEDIEPAAEAVAALWRELTEEGK